MGFAKLAINENGNTKRNCPKGYLYENVLVARGCHGKIWWVATAKAEIVNTVESQQTIQVTGKAVSDLNPMKENEEG